MDLTKFIDFLETYNGRDKVLRMLCYSAKCFAGLVEHRPISKKLDNFSSQLSACRATLRLLDDIPMLAYVVEYGWGKKDKDEYIRLANVLSNAVDVLFYPVDHMSWAIDYGVVECKDSRWGTASTVFWAISLYLTIAKSMRGLYLLSEEKLQMRTTDMNSSAMAAIRKKQRALLISALRASADIIYAIHYLPDGILWSGALKKWHVGALGSFSSLLGLYQALS